MGTVLREICPCCQGDNYEVLVSESASTPFFIDKIKQEVLVPYSEQRLRSILKHFADDHFDQRCCRHCGFIWQGRILDKAGMQELYEVEEDTNINEEILRKFVKSHKNVSGVRLLKNVLEPLWYPQKKITKQRVLDFGCGLGRWLELARALGAEVVGVELSEKKRTFLQSRGLLVFASLSETPQKNFDVINCDQVLEHVEDPKELLQELVTGLNPEGIVRLSVPNGRGCAKKLRAQGITCQDSALAPFEHINVFENRSLKYLARSCALVPLFPRLRYTYGRGMLNTLRNYGSNVLKYYTKTTLLFCKKK